MIILLEHFCIYFIFGWLLVYTMTLIFKNNSFYYNVFLMSIIFFGSFYKELFTDFPLYINDAYNIIFNLVGGMCGIIIAELSKRYRYKQSRLK